MTSKLLLRSLNCMPTALFEESQALKRVGYHISNYSSEAGAEIKPEILTSDKDLELTKKTISLVNEQIKDKTTGKLFAIIHVMSKQYLVKPNDLVCVLGPFYPTIGDKIRMEKVLAVGCRDFTCVGRAVLPKDFVNITATVVEKTVSSTNTIVKWVPKKLRYMKFEYDPYTILRINSIVIDHPINELPDVQGVEGRTF